MKKIYSKSFSELTPESSYWLGFLAADGCIYKSPAGQLSLYISLNKNDLEHLQLLKNFLKCKNKIYERKETNSYQLRIGNKKMCIDIMKYGILPRKSTIGNDLLLDIPDNMKDYFIAGYFDGDGSIFTYTKTSSYKNKNYVYKIPVVTITSNLLTSKSIISYLKTNYNFKKLSIVKNGSVYRIRWDRLTDIMEFYKLYRKSSVHLKRKISKYNMLNKTYKCVYNQEKI